MFTGEKGKEVSFEMDAKQNMTIFLKQFEDFINRQSFLVKNQPGSQEVTFRLSSRQVTAVSVGFGGESGARAWPQSPLYSLIRIYALALHRGAFSLSHTRTRFGHRVLDSNLNIFVLLPSCPPRLYLISPLESLSFLSPDGEDS